MATALSAMKTKAQKINIPREDLCGRWGNWITPKKYAFYLGATAEFAGEIRFLPGAHEGRPGTRSAQLLDAQTTRAGISLVDILSSGFGDANVPTQRNQSDRRDRCRQSKDKPHPRGISRTAFWTKRSQ
jgi:hypothetical protein